MYSFPLPLTDKKPQVPNGPIRDVRDEALIPFVKAFLSQSKLQWSMNCNNLNGGITYQITSSDCTAFVIARKYNDNAIVIFSSPTLSGMTQGPMSDIDCIARDLYVNVCSLAMRNILINLQ